MKNLKYNFANKISSMSYFPNTAKTSNFYFKVKFHRNIRNTIYKCRINIDKNKYI